VACNDGAAMPDLISQLRANPQDFNLFQAISLLERSEPRRTPVGRGVGADEALRLASQVEMAFAPSDIASVDVSARPGPPLMLRTAALSLAGAQGPLAVPFTELLLARRRARDGAGLDFLDIFNQRLIGFWYRARCKHHLSLQGTGGPALLPRSLDALSGLGLAEGAHGPRGEAAWLRHAGLQGAAPRSLASLLTLLRDRLGVRFEGKQFEGGWHALAAGDRAHLRGLGGGRAAQRLDGGASLGARAWDQSAGIALSAPALMPSQFAALLPGGIECGLLAWLVARHLQRDFTVTLELKLATAPESRLGGRRRPGLQAKLGRSAWLCGRAAPGQPERQYQAARFQLPAQGS